MSFPKISYLISTYDSAHFLDRHLADLQNQTDPNWEAIIINSASPGNDLAIAKKWMALDKRIKCLDQPTRTPYGVSWVLGWQFAHGIFVCNSNTDDLHDPRFTEIFWHYMSKADIKTAFWYSGWKVINESGQLLHEALKPPFDKTKFKYECTAGPQVAWRNQNWLGKQIDWKVIYDLSARHTSAFDYSLWLYFMSLGYIGEAIPEILTIYTQRPTSIENRQPSRNTYESLASISQFFPDSLPKEWPEFKDFSALPNKEEWINKRMKGEKWNA